MQERGRHRESEREREIELLQHLLTQIYSESPTASRITVTRHVNSSLGLKSSRAKDVWEWCPSPDNQSVAHKSGSVEEGGAG